MADESLLMLFKEVRGKTLRLLEGVSEEMARFAPPGLHNTILWHVGHIFVVVEHLGVSAIANEPVAIPDGWFEMFSWKSDPRTVTRWPMLGEIVPKLREQEERLAGLIGRLTSQDLARPWGDPSRDRTLRYAVIHGIHDEANHQGELWLQKKLAQKSS